MTHDATAVEDGPRWMHLRDPATLAAIRKAAGVTQRELAARLGCSRGTVGDLESGRQRVVQQPVAEAIAKELRGVDVGLLFVAKVSRLSSTTHSPAEQSGRVA